MGRPAGWMKQLNGREAMCSPRAPSHRREIERQFWAKIATGITSEKAAEAVGVSPALGAWAAVSASIRAGPRSTITCGPKTDPYWLYLTG